MDVFAEVMIKSIMHKIIIKKSIIETIDLCQYNISIVFRKIDL